MGVTNKVATSEKVVLWYHGSQDGDIPEVKNLFEFFGER